MSPNPPSPSGGWRAWRFELWLDRLRPFVYGHGGPTGGLRWPHDIRLEERNAKRDHLRALRHDESQPDVCRRRAGRPVEMDLVRPRRAPVNGL